MLKAVFFIYETFTVIANRCRIELSPSQGFKYLKVTLLLPGCKPDNLNSKGPPAPAASDEPGSIFC
jgi:hypothetical protein